MGEPLISYTIPTQIRDLVDESVQKSKLTHYLRKRRRIVNYYRSGMTSTGGRYTKRVLISNTMLLHEAKTEKAIFPSGYTQRLIFISFVFLLFGALMLAGLLYSILKFSSKIQISKEFLYLGFGFVGLVLVYAIQNIFRYFFRRHLTKKTIKKLDDLYTIYTGNPLTDYAVQIRKRHIRILYNKQLVVVKGNRIKSIANVRDLRRAYLYMMPLSVFDLYKYITLPKETDVDKQDDKKFRLNVEIGSHCDNKDWQAVSIDPNVPKARKWFGIYKELFVFDSEGVMQESYLAVDESKYYNTNYLTWATLVERDEQAKSDLMTRLQKYPAVIKAIQKCQITPIESIIEAKRDSNESSQVYYD